MIIKSYFERILRPIFSFFDCISSYEIKKIETQDINSIFIFLFLIFALLFIIQFIDLKFYKYFFLNNSSSGLLNTFFEVKAYNPRVNDITGVFIQQIHLYLTMRAINHFMVPNFIIFILKY